MPKLQPKKSKLDKNLYHTTKPRTKPKRGDHKEYMAKLHTLGLSCIECGTYRFIELHHVVPGDDRTVVPLCSFCHRGDEREGRTIYDDDMHKENPKNGHSYVTKGYCVDQGTKSGMFKNKWQKEKLLKIADDLWKTFGN